MRRRSGLLAAAVALHVSGCAVAPPAAPPVDTAVPASPAPFTTLATGFTARALKQERDGDLRRALDSWKVVAALRPSATEPNRRVDDLTARLAADAEQRYLSGVAKLREGDAVAARRELLLALFADPDHAAALDALKNRVAPDAVPYTVAAGDTFESIAATQLHDPATANLVARINRLDPADRPVPGTVLSLPELSPPATRARSKRAAEPAADADEPLDSVTYPDPLGLAGGSGTAPPPQARTTQDPAEARLAKATELFHRNRFAEAADAAARLSDDAAVGTRALALAASAWFAIGDADLRENRFAEAVVAYKKASPAHADIPSALAAVEHRKKELAEVHYNDGVRSFINQKLDEAIFNWKQTLALNPEHPHASKDIEKARGLQQKLKDFR